MKCDHVEKQFSELFEGTLSAARAKKVREHLAGCDGCSAAYRQFEEAMGALHGIERRRTSTSMKAAMLRAVDVAVEEINEEQANGFRRAALHREAELDAGASSEHWRGKVGSALFGAAAAALLIFAYGQYSQTENDLGSDDSGLIVAVLPDNEDLSNVLPESEVEPEPTESEANANDVTHSSEAAAIPEPVTVIEYVTEYVDVVVEVPTLIEVERFIETGPLFVVDTSPLAGLAGQLIANLEDINRGRELEIHAAAELAQSVRDENQQRASAPRTTPRTSNPFGNSRTFVSTVEEFGQVTLETNGTLDEYVPVLMGMLGDENSELVSLVESDLERIRARARSIPGISAHLIEPVITRKPESAFESWFGSPREATDATWEERWSAWWTANRDTLIKAEADDAFWSENPGTLLDA